jgi:uncharacterized protein (DUF305 family)
MNGLPTVLKIRKSALSLILILLFIHSACIGTEPLTEQPVESELVKESDNRDFSELEALYWSRLESSRMSFVQADVDFMTDMIAHHAQALIMSELAPKNGASHSVQTLAARIHNAQLGEIETMQKWLRDRGQPVPEVHIDGLLLMIHLEVEAEEPMDHGMMDHSAMGHHNVHDEEEMSHDSHDDHEEEMSHDGHGNQTEEDQMMSNHSMHHHHDMPGMLTQEQLEELAEATGTEFDRKFLTFMIEHHEGAVYMVNELFASDGAANDNEIFDLASDIHVEQITEINRMKLMLEELQ